MIIFKDRDGKLFRPANSGTENFSVPQTAGRISFSVPVCEMFSTIVTINIFDYDLEADQAHRLMLSAASMFPKNVSPKKMH